MHSFKLLPRKIDSSYPSINDYQNQLIGSGSFGKVYQSKHILTHKIFAIKAISKYDLKGDHKDSFMLEQVNHELEIMYQLNSEYIIKVYDHFQDQKNIYIVLEYADGVELYKGIIQKKKRLENVQIARVIYQLCLALQHLHEKNIIHRDIKPENIMLLKNKNIKLIDFGTSNYVGPEEIRMTRTGSIPYFAPQIVTRTKHGEPVDVWCVGILLYEMYVLKTPFQEIQKTQINIITNKVSYPHSMEVDMKDLIEKILVKDPKKRLKINQIIKHPWIVKYVIGNIPELGLGFRSRSLQKQELSTRRMSPKSISHKSMDKSKQTSKSRSKEKSRSKQPVRQFSKSKSTKSLSKAKTVNDILKEKVSKLNKQISEANQLNKRQQEKQKLVLQKRVMDLQNKLMEYSKKSSKYENIIRINNKKIRDITQEINDFQIFKQQNSTIQDHIHMRKQQQNILIENRKALRMQLANLETKLRINQSANKNMRRLNPSQSKSRSKSSRKPILSNRSNTNFNCINSSLDKYLSTKSEKMTTEGSVRETNMAEIETYINSLKNKHKYDGEIQMK